MRRRNFLKIEEEYRERKRKKKGKNMFKKKFE